MKKDDQGKRKAVKQGQIHHPHPKDWLAKYRLAERGGMLHRFGREIETSCFFLRSLLSLFHSLLTFASLSALLYSELTEERS